MCSRMEILESDKLTNQLALQIWPGLDGSLWQGIEVIVSAIVINVHAITLIPTAQVHPLGSTLALHEHLNGRLTCQHSHCVLRSII